jgi:hypothetical protein
MAVAFDASAESDTGTTGSVSEASFTWDITPVGTPRGVGVAVFTFAGADKVTTVTADGVGLSEIAEAVDSAGEKGRTTLFYLGASVPATTPLPIVVNRTNDATVMYAIAFTVTAGGDTEIYTTGIVKVEGDVDLAEQSVDDGSPGTNSLRFAFATSGLGVESNLPAGANSTLLHSFDRGAMLAAGARETTAGQGARNVGFDASASDDCAAIHFAVREIAGAGLGIPIAAYHYNHHLGSMQS